MWKQKVGVSVGNQYTLPSTDVIEIVSAIGFEAVSLAWSADANVSELVSTARNCGLDIQTLHAPFQKAAALWDHDSSIGVPARQEPMTVLESCEQHQIPIMVTHTWIGFNYTFDAENLNFENYDAVVAKAKEYGVKIAFENTEGEEYLFALMDRYKGEAHVGFCWDSGHEMCYNYSIDLLKDFGDRLLVTHLNDNLGISRFDGVTYWTDDLHLLPYDGIADWDYNVERLKNSRKLDIINFEVGKYSKPNRHENDIYEKMSDTEYYTEAYKRACKIAYRYSK